jgi:hypothetical protein
VPSGLRNVVAIAAAGAHSLALVGPTPAISLLSARASGAVAVVKVRITGWEMYPAFVGKRPNRPDGGHWRIYVDGRYDGLSANPTSGRTHRLTPGSHRIAVALANDDGSRVAGAHPSRTLTVTIGRRS